jgi:protein-S-isoprenylcysteine O-methyltransferase Ste14
LNLTEKTRSLNRKLIWCACAEAWNVVKNKLSFGNMKVFSGVQEALVLALMLVTILALFYVNMDITYKIGIAVIAFAIIFLATLAAALLRQQKEIKQAQA